jgi:hypothetical protein
VKRWRSERRWFSPPCILLERARHERFPASVATSAPGGSRSPNRTVGLGAPMSSIVAILFAGAFFCNCIPHLASGLRGEPFPTPFARPRGVGNSSPLANVLWGTANLAVALALGSGTAAPDRAPHLAAAVAGFLLMGIYLAWHFRRVRTEHARRVEGDDARW